MGKLLFCCIVVINIATVIYGVNKNISLEEKTKLSSDIRKHFYSDCICLVCHGGLTNDLKIFRFVKLINGEGMTNTLADLPNGKNAFDRQTYLCKNPLFVVPHIGVDTKYLLRKFSSLVNTSRGVWLLFLDMDVLLEEFFAGIDVPFDCEFLVAQLEDDHVVLTEVYRVSPKLPLHTYRFGTWSSERGLTWPVIGFYYRRNDLYGFALKTGFKKSQQLDTSVQEMKRTSPKGFMGILWAQLEAHLNFTTNYQNPLDNAFGGRTQNGSWAGVIGMLKRREVEISNVVFVMTSDRMDAVDFTVPYLDIRTYLIIRQPTTFYEKWNAFLIPFSSELWAALLIAIVFITLCLGTMYLLGIRYANFTQKDLRFITAVFLAIGIFCSQGHSISPRSTSLRIMFETAYLTGVIVVASYSAAFITHLTLRDVELPFKNFKEFLADNTYRLGMMPNSAQIDYFKESKVDLLKKIYWKKVYPYTEMLPKSDSEGLEWICTQKNYAHVTSTYNLIQLGEKLSCGIVLIPQAFFPGSISVAMVKDSHYKGLFNHKLQAMRRFGLLKGAFKRFSYNLRRDKELVGPSSVTFSEVIPILSILGTGALLSVVVIAVEIWISKCCRILKTKRDSKISRKRGNLVMCNSDIRRTLLYGTKHASNVHRRM